MIYFLKKLGKTDLYKKSLHLSHTCSITTRQLVEQYEERCRRFRNSATVGQFRELFPATATPSRLSSGRVPVILKLENSWGIDTIADLNTLVTMLGVHGNYLHLSSTRFGCIAVTWLCSTDEVEQLKRAITEAADSLQTMRVLQVFIGEDLVLDHSHMEHVSNFTNNKYRYCIFKLDTFSFYL